MNPQKTIFITGTSSGIGNGLARYYLEQGHRVLGLNRRRPEDLLQYEAFRFMSTDLGQMEEISPSITQLTNDIQRLDLVILNAGVLGNFGDLGDTPLSDLSHTMEVNVWANKLVLDALFEQGITINQVVSISSGASVNGNRGWSGYSLSKATLNMLMKLYAHEQPATHFCALSPGIVDTPILEYLCSRESDTRYPSLDVICAKRHTSEMPAPDQAAPYLANVMAELPKIVPSGEYADVRTL